MLGISLPSITSSKNNDSVPSYVVGSTFILLGYASGYFFFYYGTKISGRV